MRRIVVIVAAGWLLAIAGGLLAGRWLTDLEAVPVMPCASTVVLTPREERGPWWVPHRQWLEVDGWHIGPRRTYSVQNERTGETFRWGPARFVTGRTRSRRHRASTRWQRLCRARSVHA